MNTLIAFLPFLLLVLLFCLYAVAAKLAAVLTRRFGIRWRMCFFYALIVEILSVAIADGLALLERGMSPALGSTVEIAVQIAVGIGFFSVNAVRESGAAAGWRGGLLLSVTALAINLAAVALLTQLATSLTIATGGMLPQLAHRPTF